MTPIITLMNVLCFGQVVLDSKSSLQIKRKIFFTNTFFNIIFSLIHSLKRTFLGYSNGSKIIQ